MNLTKENLSSFDAVILATDHDIFDYELIRNHSKLQLIHVEDLPPSDNIIRG